jgi:hypothetical protein
MIEATLDRTLLHEDPTKEASKVIVQKALGKITVSLPVEKFISKLVQKTAAEKSLVEDYFWELLDKGEILLSSDFKVQLRK